MVRPEDLQLFVRSVVLGNFSLAAREADIKPSQVSAGVARLEQQLDKRLLLRSTRKIRLTAQ